eukprot:TRINITY_DN6719_c0_g3_i2.p1 TRINITY_DN6719_c0_g3~~TRINITY_DN6719_c0_g3_i2.p1  ORF type:complete len:470 (-),score=96.46 TRINITY_DN6719_c0_g3_i2:1393-2742(-)
MPDCVGFSSQTVSSYMKRKTPNTYGNLLRSVADRFQKLQAEVASESVAGLEFEEAARKTFDHLDGQMGHIQEAFNALVDTLTGELEYSRRTLQDEVRSELDSMRQRLESRWALLEGRSAALEVRSAELEGRSAELEVRVDASLSGLRRDIEAKLEDELSVLRSETFPLRRDLDDVVQTLPKLRETLRSDAQDMFHRLNDALVQAREQADRLGVKVERMDTSSRKMDADIREELDDRHRKLQQNVTRQLESMGRVLAERPVLSERRTPRTHVTSGLGAASAPAPAPAPMRCREPMTPSSPPSPLGSRSGAFGGCGSLAAGAAAAVAASDFGGDGAMSIHSGFPERVRAASSGSPARDLSTRLRSPSVSSAQAFGADDASVLNVEATLRPTTPRGSPGSPQGQLRGRPRPAPLGLASQSTPATPMPASQASSNRVTESLRRPGTRGSSSLF